MTFSDVLDWLENNRETARKLYSTYGAFTPYGVEDFDGLVHEAAFAACMLFNTQDKHPYEAIFRVTLQDRLSQMVPGYGWSPKGPDSSNSTSVSSHLCVSFDDLLSRHDCDGFDESTNIGSVHINPLRDCDIDGKSYEFHNPAFTAEHAYDLVHDKLDERERKVLFYSLGLSESGCNLSCREIASKTGISKSTVSREMNSIPDKVKKLVESGCVVPYSPLPSSFNIYGDRCATA